MPFLEAAKEKFGYGYNVIFLETKKDKFLLGYGVMSFPEAAKEKC